MFPFNLDNNEIDKLCEEIKVLKFCTKGSNYVKIDNNIKINKIGIKICNIIIKHYMSKRNDFEYNIIDYIEAKHKIKELKEVLKNEIQDM